VMNNAEIRCVVCSEKFTEKVLNAMNAKFWSHISLQFLNVADKVPSLEFIVQMEPVQEEALKSTTRPKILYFEDVVKMVCPPLNFHLHLLTVY
jgi:Iap family predicted aminopeptidase